MLVRSLYSMLALILATALLAGCGGDGEDDTDGGDDRRTTKTAPEPDDAPDAAEPAEDDGPTADAEFSVTVSDGAVEGGPQAFRVKVGDNVSITIASDAADDAHLHGIDTSVEIPANGEATLRFMVPDQGSYELEMHESGALLGTVIAE